MKPAILNISFLLLSFSSLSQSQTFEISGTISGDYNSKIYLFYDGHYRQKDSISSEIKDGRFYFKASAPLPILGRLHLDQTSFLRDIYIDSRYTTLICTNTIKIDARTKDTVNDFSLIDVKGSLTENLKQNFENWVMTNDSSIKSPEEKNEAYYDKLYAFATQYPKNKVSLYLVSKAYDLNYTQVKTLSNLTDTILSNSFEKREVEKLLNFLDKSKNKSIGNPFWDVVLKDTTGTDLKTKSLRGKYILVEFWASWCKPCRADNPELKTLYDKLKTKEFEILGVSFDNDQVKWKNAIRTDGLTWKQVIDEKGSAGGLGEHYAIEAIPTNILLDKEGKIIGVDLSVKEIEDIIVKSS